MLTNRHMIPSKKQDEQSPLKGPTVSSADYSSLASYETVLIDESWGYPTLENLFTEMVSSDFGVPERRLMILEARCRAAS
jgi:hypothetical protein